MYAVFDIITSFMSKERISETIGRELSPEQWLLKEGEMTEQETRTLGHLLYTLMFTRIPMPIEALLEEAHTRSGKSSKDFDVRGIPAEQYVEKFAEAYGMNPTVLKRFAHRASIELATIILPAEMEEFKQRAQEEIEPTDEYGHVIDSITRIAQRGIQTHLVDHRVLIDQAYILKPHHNTPLNANLLGSTLMEP
jgi:hypothetical protein